MNFSWPPVVVHVWGAEYCNLAIIPVSQLATPQRDVCTDFEGSAASFSETRTLPHLSRLKCPEGVAHPRMLRNV